MISRILAVVSIAVAGAIGGAGSAGAFGVGLGVPAVPVPTPVSVPSAVDSVVSGAGNVVTATVHAPAADPVFAGPTDVPTDGVTPGVYRAFENLVNDALDGGGSRSPVLSGDAFTIQGVDGGVAGLPAFAPARLLM